VDAGARSRYFARAMRRGLKKRRRAAALQKSLFLEFTRWYFCEL